MALVCAVCLAIHVNGKPSIALNQKYFSVKLKLFSYPSV